MIKLPETLEHKERYQGILDFCVSEWAAPTRIAAFTRLGQEDIKSIWDIGANIGTFLDVAITRFPGAEIHAIEPDNHNCEVLQFNFGANPKVHIHNVGIYYGVHEGYSMNVSGDPSIGGYMFSALPPEHLGPYADRTVINSTLFHMKELEELFSEPADVIKMDIEGSEFNVIEHSTLLKQAKFILLETHNHTFDYMDAFIRQHLPMFKFNLEPLGPGSDHHGYAFLERR